MAHFRFSVQGEFMDEMKGDSCLIVWDLHVEHEYQRKGLGKHLLTIMELIAKREGMSRIYIPIQLNDEIGLEWIESVCKPRGYFADESLLNLIGFDSEMEGFQPYCKMLTKPLVKAAPTADAVPTTVFTSPAPQEEVTDAEKEDEDVAAKMKLLNEMYEEKFGKQATTEELNEWILQMAAQAEENSNKENNEANNSNED